MASIFAAKADKKLRTPSLNKAVAGNGDLTVVAGTNIFTVSKPTGYFQPYMALVTAGGTYVDYAPSPLYTAVNGVKPVYMN
jgi:hypothetical protein